MADTELAPPPAKGKKATFKRQRNNNNKKLLPKKPYPHRAKRGASLVYDPLAHAEYVTGFRKRKNARRLEAQAKLAETEKEKLKEARRDKRQFIRESASRMRGHVGGVASAPGDNTEEKEEYQAEDEYPDTVFTATVTRMDTANDMTFVKSTLSAKDKKYSRSKPLTKDIAATKKKAAAELAASVAASLKGGGRGRKGQQGIQKKKRTKGAPSTTRKDRRGDNNNNKTRKAT